MLISQLLLAGVAVALLLWLIRFAGQVKDLESYQKRTLVTLREYELYQASQWRLDRASDKVRSVLDDSTAGARETHQLIADKGFEYLAKWPAARRHMPTIKRVHDLGSDVGYALFSLSKKLPSKKNK